MDIERPFDGMLDLVCPACGDPIGGYHVSPAHIPGVASIGPHYACRTVIVADETYASLRLATEQDVLGLDEEQRGYLREFIVAAANQ